MCASTTSFQNMNKKDTFLLVKYIYKNININFLYILVIRNKSIQWIDLKNKGEANGHFFVFDV